MSRGTSVKPPDNCTHPGCNAFAIAGGDKCSVHTAHNQKRFRTAMYSFKSRDVQQAFEMMLRADDRLSLDNELALMRTCLQGVVAKCEASKVEELGPHAIAAITSLAGEVARTCDIVARIEQKYATHVPMEVLLFFIQLVAETLTKHVGADEAEACVSAILDLPLPQEMDGEGNTKLFRKTLGRGPMDPMKREHVSLKGHFSDRQAKIDALRKQSAELRAQIAASESAIEEDKDLAPAEPNEVPEDAGQ